ncbi:MAG: YggS family pyridoxal phosphate-dependent enzyme [Epsilonproteobacteria bacterium]|nr:YggS family pyridoxal phosphate-dependent enzyme [Campylobacterota bacterium]
MILDKEVLRDRLDRLIWEIEEARIKRSEHLIVQLVVVSKYTESENIRTLYELGQRAFGENQVQQLEKRVNELNDLPIAWHQIGTLQTNKINKLIDLEPFLLQSLDSIKLANELNKRLEKKDKTMDALLQINSSYEESKSGVKPEEAVDIYQEIKERFNRINLKGVMTIGAHSKDESKIRKSFERTYNIFEKLQKDGAKICSMGMSGDFKIAIESGSNMVRIGSYLFREP